MKIVNKINTKKRGSTVLLFFGISYTISTTEVVNKAWTGVPRSSWSDSLSIAPWPGKNPTNRSIPFNHCGGSIKVNGQ